MASVALRRVRLVLGSPALQPSRCLGPGDVKAGFSVVTPGRLRLSAEALAVLFPIEILQKRLAHQRVRRPVALLG